MRQDKQELQGYSWPDFAAGTRKRGLAEIDVHRGYNGVEGRGTKALV